jgi:hypothetical protein
LYGKLSIQLIEYAKINHVLTTERIFNNREKQVK